MLSSRDPSIPAATPPASPAAAILAIHPGALGDLVLTFPILTQLKAQGEGVDLLCQGKIGALARSLGLIDQAYDLEASWSAALFTQPLAPQICRWLQGYSILLVFSQAPELVALEISLSGPQVICLSPRPPVEQPIHTTRFLWRALRQAGLRLPTSIPPPRGLLDGPGAGSAADSDPTRLAAAGNRSNLLALHPGSGSPRKNLSLDCWFEVAGLLMARGYTPLWLLGPAEIERHGELAARVPNGQISRSVTDLVELAAILADVHGFIGHDSGVTHLAAFLGLPVLALFGPSDPFRWRPWGPQVKVLRALLACRPCFETERINCAEDSCRRAITAPMIVDTWIQWALARVEQTPSP